MKHLKQKLLAATAMLMVSAVMLSSASYAWFAISTAPTVNSIVTDIHANEALEIASKPGSDAPAENSALGDTGKNDTWGGSVTFAEGAFNGSYIGPATARATDGADQANNYSDLKVASYGADGRPNELVNITWVPQNDDGSNYKGFDIGYDNGDTATANAVAIRFPLWLRTNVTGDITLNDLEITGLEDDNSLYDLVTVGVKMGTTVDNTNKITEMTLAEASADQGVSIITDAVPNQAYPVTIYIYLNGHGVQNKDMAETVTGLTLSGITFRNSAIDGDNSYVNPNAPAAPGP